MAYVGTEAKIPLGEVGLLTDVAADKQPPNSLIWAKNVSFFNGSIQKAPGTLKWNSVAADAGIVSVYDYWPTTVGQRMVCATSAGSLYIGRDRQLGTAVNTGLGALTPNCQFVEGGQEAAGNPKKLFLFTGGVSNPYVLNGDGTSFALISSPATDWSGINHPKCGVIHRARLWAFAGQIAYASASSSHENFTSNYLAMPVYPGEGGEILGAFVFKGKLFVFKDKGFVYILNDISADETDWYWEKIASNFGLSAPNAVAEVLDAMFAGNTYGTITNYAATANLIGSVEAADLVQQCQFEAFLRATTNEIGLTQQHLYYYEKKKLLFATYRSGYYTYNDMLVVFDFGRQNPRPSYWIKGYPQCLAKYLDVKRIARPMYGDKDGYIHIMDYEDRLEGSTAYVGDFQIPHLDFSYLDPSLSVKQKHFDFLSVHYVPEGNWNLSCDYFIDGRFVETINFEMVQNTNQTLNTFVLNTDRLAAQQNEETVVRTLRGSGRTFSARFYNSGSNQSFQIPAITIGFRPGAEEATR